jgi:digeranylgeranylglycerophospholipid reductase
MMTAPAVLEKSIKNATARNMNPKQDFDVVIIGASFSGLTLAHHLPKHLRVLVVDAKPEAGSTVESTGLITSKTYDEFKAFFDIDSYITNQISSICVVAPNFKDYFVSTVDQPWIYQTDTKALVKKLADTVPQNVEVRMRTVMTGVGSSERIVLIKTQGKDIEEIQTKFLVGADGSHSKVAVSTNLSQNTKFLFGYEKVYFGDVHLGDNPEETIYHFWFGEFSLGYGGWLSPTIVDGKKAFRIGLAKNEHERGKANELLDKFTHRLVNDGVISIEGDVKDSGYTFGSLIPMSGTLKRIYKDGVLLIGDAAGLCGAFAADGIKGSVVSGKISAELINRYLKGDTDAPGELISRINNYNSLINYYRRQMRYRWIWDRMKSNRTFTAMFEIIQAERDTFLDQFCDSKDTRRSLSWTVLKFKYIFKLAKYSFYILLDFFKR